jgi:hypothetical protein
MGRKVDMGWQSNFEAVWVHYGLVFFILFFFSGTNLFFSAAEIAAYGMNGRNEAHNGLVIYLGIGLGATDEARFTAG